MNPRPSGRGECQIPVEANGGWNEDHRNTLNNVSQKISELGLRWAAEYPHSNHLTQNNEDGQPWMLFNGGEAIDLEPVETQNARFGI